MVFYDINIRSRFIGNLSMKRRTSSLWIRTCVIFLIAFAAANAQAQITLSLNTVSVRWIGDNFNGGPWFPDISITGSGTLSQGTCTGNTTLCNALNSTFTPSTAAPATLTLWTQTFVLGAFVGTALSHLTINSTNGCAANCVIDITYVGQPRSSLWAPTIVSPGGSFSGCSTTTTYNGWVFWDHDICNWLPDQAPGGTFQRPGTHSSYVDGNFGGSPTQVNDPGFGYDARITNSKDSAGTDWNTDHSRFLTEYESGRFLIWKTATKTVEFGSHNNLPGGQSTWWDCCNP